MKGKAWLELEKQHPEIVARRTKAIYYPNQGVYKLESFGKPFLISIPGRKIVATEPLGELFLQRFSYVIYPIFLWYLLRAEKKGRGENFLSYRSLKGGETFFRGSHEMPLGKLLEIFDSNPELIIKAAKKLGAENFTPGDLAFKFYPLPKAPVVLSFWKGEDNIPSSANLLLDSSVQDYLLLDLIWALLIYVCRAITLTIEAY